MQEMQVQSLGWEDPLEMEMATCSSILAWEIIWTEEATVHEIAKSWTRLSTPLPTSFFPPTLSTPPLPLHPPPRTLCPLHYLHAIKLLRQGNYSGEKDYLCYRIAR